jgi:Protein of unknown function (DUF2726)
MLDIEPLSELALLASVLLAVSLLSLRWLRRRGSAAPRRARDESLDTVQAWTPQAVRVMTLPERKAFELLRRALPRNHMVLAQVPLARFISVPTEHSYADWLSKVGRLCPDLVVCDASSRVIAIVEIAKPDDGERSRKRHERVHRVVQAAGLPVHVWTEGAMPSVAEARALFDKRTAADDTGAEWAQLGDHGQPLIPVPDIQEMLAEGDDAFAHDPLHDPVASGFFDDLDSRRAGLGRA